MTRQMVLSIAILVLLMITVGLQVRQIVVDHQPFTQYCEWVQPGKVLSCHR